MIYPKLTRAERDKIETVIEYTRRLQNFVQSHEMILETKRASIKNEITRMKIWLNNQPVNDERMRKRIMYLYKNISVAMGKKSDN